MRAARSKSRRSMVFLTIRGILIRAVSFGRSHSPDEKMAAGRGWWKSQASCRIWLNCPKAVLSPNDARKLRVSAPCKCRSCGKWGRRSSPVISLMSHRLSERHEMTTLLQVEDLTVTYQTPRGVVHAVSEVNLDIKSGETVGLVGETGCGKSSLAKAVVRLREVERGAIRLNGVDLVPLSDNDLQPHRRLMSIIFQDPAASLDPRRSISWLIEEPLRVNGEMGRGERASRVAELM